MDTTARTARAPGGPARSVSVVVPSYRRPRQVLLCLAGLRAQTRPPDEIVVAVRDTDLATRDVLAEHDDVTVVVVHEPGVLAAMNAGVAASGGDIVAFTDDDAVPRRQWLARL